MKNPNYELANHCILVPFAMKCEVMFDRAYMLTGVQPHTRAYKEFDVKCKSIANLLEDELDEVMTDLMAGVLKKKDKQQAIGRAKGLCVSLAIIRNPHNPNPDPETDASMIRLGYEPE